VLLNSDTPVVDGRLFVVGGDGDAPGKDSAPGFLYVLNAKTGHLLWSQKTPNSIYAEPIISDGRVLVGEGNALFGDTEGIPSLQVGTVRGVGPSGVYAFSVQTGWPLFIFNTPGADQAPATIYQGRVYIASGSRYLYVLDLKTGQFLWDVNMGHYDSRSSPRIIGGLAIMGGAGPLGVVAVNIKTHGIAWQRPLSGAIGGVDDTTLAVSGDRLIGAAVLEPNSGQNNQSFRAVVFALNVANGHILWLRQVAEGRLPAFKETGTPVISHGVVYVGNALNGEVRALSLATGRVLWSIDAGAPVTRPPVVRDGRVLWVSQRGEMQEATVAGRLVYHKSLGPFVTTYGPVVVGNTVYVTANTPKYGVLMAFSWPGLESR
jgi:outer membrane protein assembly factor BamB